MSNGQMIPVDSAQSAMQARIKRPTYLYTVPTDLQRYGIKTFALVELNAREEIMAAKRADNQPVRLAFELARESLREVDGVAVSTAEGTADSVFDSMHPKVRTLLITAYSDLHNPSDKETASFLKSREMRVG